MDKKIESDWQELSEHILTDIFEWRINHPKATFREIEEEVHKRMSRLEMQVLQDAAQASESREWSGKEAQERPQCSVCQTPLWPRGKRKRKLQGVQGQEVTLIRDYGTCPSCGVGVFPPR